MDIDQLLATWKAYEERAAWQTVAATAENGDDAELARRTLGGLPEVSALQALAATRELSELLTRRRWSLIYEARRAGASWTEVGAALNTTKQGAQDWYSRHMVEHEQYG